MENLGLFIYIYAIWDNLKSLNNEIITTLIIFSITTTVCYVCYYTSEKPEKWNDEETIKEKKLKLLKLNKIFKKTMILSFVSIIIFLIVNALMPKKEYLPLIAFGSDVAEEVKESLSSGKLNKLNELLNLKIEKMIEDLKDETQSSEPEK